MTVDMLLRALTEQQRDDTIFDAFALLVFAYYEEYEDATDLDHNTSVILDSWLHNLFFEIHLDVDIAEAVRKGEREINERYGRSVRTERFYRDEEGA